MVTANQKSAIDTHTKKKKQSKSNIKDSHQITREENNRGREEKNLQKQTQNNEQNGNKNIHIDNYLNVNGLSAPTKRHRLAEWIQKQDQ